MTGVLHEDYEALKKAHNIMETTVFLLCPINVDKNVFVKFTKDDAKFKPVFITIPSSEKFKRIIGFIIEKEI